MLISYLFPHRFKRLGWVLVVAAATLGLLDLYSPFHLPPLLAWLPPLIGYADPFNGSHGTPAPAHENI